MTTFTLYIESVIDLNATSIAVNVNNNMCCLPFNNSISVLYHIGHCLKKL